MTSLPGVDEKDIQTPCLILDLDALERNIKKMGNYAKAHGMRHRCLGTMHMTADVQKLQENMVAWSAFAVSKSAKRKFLYAVASRTFWRRTKCVIRPRSTVWRACQKSVRVLLSASTIWRTLPGFPPRRTSTHDN